MNVTDIMANSNITDPIEVMSTLLECRHICPTAPSTLKTYPFQVTDPFILKEAPNVYFVGNQEKFATGIFNKDGVNVRLISIPKFIINQGLTLMDIETLEVFLLDFSQNNTE